MRHIIHPNQTNPFINCALEEFLLRQTAVEPPFFLLYVNEPAVVIGRNQNVFEETDPEYLQDNQIHLVRRLSGGGTVFHDFGNLNFSFFSPGRENIHNFKRFTDPISKVLSRWQIAAEMRHNGSLFIAEKKISGHAQYATGSRLLSHGTLLFSAEMDALSPALKPRLQPAVSKAVASIRSPVRNLQPLLPPGLHFTDLQAAIRSEIGGEQTVAYEITARDWQQIEILASDQYRSWEWLYGRNPRFSITRHLPLAASRFSIHVEINKGRIAEILLENPPEPKGMVRQLTAALIGTPYDQQSLTDRLRQLTMAGLGQPFSDSEWLNLIY